MKTLCKEMRAGPGNRRLLPQFGRRLMQLGAVVTGLLVSISVGLAQVLTEPDNGWSMDDVRARFGEPGTVRGPVGNPAVTRWDYIDFSVYFENSLVIVALGGDDPTNYETVADVAVPETDNTVVVKQPVQQEKPVKKREDSAIVKAAGRFALNSPDRPAQAVKVAYVPEQPSPAPAARVANVPVTSVPVNGMSMQSVTDRFGRPVSVDASVGNPPITIWRYQGFSVFFEHNIVLVSAPESNPVQRAQPGIIVDADSEPDPAVDTASQ